VDPQVLSEIEIMLGRPEAESAIALDRLEEAV
jgi:hypothetical protein